MFIKVLEMEINTIIMHLYKVSTIILLLVLLSGCSTSELHMINPVKLDSVQATDVVVIYNTASISGSFERIAILKGENNSLLHKRNSVSQRQRQLVASVGANVLLVEEVRGSDCQKQLEVEICFRFTALYVS